MCEAEVGELEHSSTRRLHVPVGRFEVLKPPEMDRMALMEEDPGSSSCKKSGQKDEKVASSSYQAEGSRCSCDERGAYGERARSGAEKDVEARC